MNKIKECLIPVENLEKAFGVSFGEGDIRDDGARIVEMLEDGPMTKSQLLKKTGLSEKRLYEVMYNLEATRSVDAEYNRRIRGRLETVYSLPPPILPYHHGVIMDNEIYQEIRTIKECLAEIKSMIEKWGAMAQSDDEERILELLDDGAIMSRSQLLRKTRIPTHKIGQILKRLHMRGQIHIGKQPSNGGRPADVYRRA